MAIEPGLPETGRDADRSRSRPERVCGAGLPMV